MSEDLRGHAADVWSRADEFKSRGIHQIPSFKPRLGGDRSASRNAVASEPGAQPLISQIS
jgi:hypothetical protein